MNKHRYHYIYDITECNDNITDKDKIKEFIYKTADALDMKILVKPIVVDGVDINPGITCFAIVDFSHISVHTFTAGDEAFIDIFSCKEYEHKNVKDLVKQYFTTPQSEIRKKQVYWG